MKKYKGSGTKDACYRKVKSRYKVWPSAYSSGALSKCRKVGVKNWGNSKKKAKGGIVIKSCCSECSKSMKSGGTFDKEKKYGLKGWFSRNNGKGWVNCKTGKSCGRKDSSKGSYPACRPTMSVCKKYKKPTGKTSSKKYNWKKKEFGGALILKKGGTLQDKKFTNSKNSEIAYFAYDYLLDPKTVKSIIGRRPVMTEHHLDGFKIDKSSKYPKIKKNNKFTVRGKKFYITNKELSKLNKAIPNYKTKQIGGNSTTYEKLVTKY